MFPEIGRVEIFLLLTRPHSQMCIRIPIVNFKNIKQTNKKKKQESKIEKETKEENRISPKN